MNSLLRLLAWLIISWPVEPCPLDNLAVYPVVAETVRKLAVEEQLIAPTDASDIRLWLGWLREARRNMRDCPRLEEAWRFPRDGEAIQLALADNKHFQAYCLIMEKTDAFRAAHFYAMRLEAIAAYDVWSSLAIAVDEYASPVRRRENLRTVRDRLGPARWWTGRMPCPVPVEHFTRMR